jgi:nucleoside-diphosphate-sugar epimerase
MNNVLKEMGKRGKFYKDKRCLITGGFGFVGSHVAASLEKAGAEVHVLDIDTDANRDSLINSCGLRDKVHIITADITDKVAMEEIIRQLKVDVIFHFAAAATVVEKAMDLPYLTVLANTLGLVNILEAVRKLNDSVYSVLFSSTDKVYGEATELPYKENATPLKAVGLYDATKMAADVLAKSYAEVFKVNVVVIRLCNLFGPYDFNIDYRLVPKSMKHIFGEGMAPELYFHSLDHFRDYLYIDDAVRAMLLLAKEKKCFGEIYNMPGCKYASTPGILKEIVNKVAEVEKRLNESDSEAVLARGIRIKMGDPYHIVIEKQHLCGEKIKDSIGFIPEISFEEGLEKTILFYRDYFQAKNKSAGGIKQNGQHGKGQFVLA